MKDKLIMLMSMAILLNLFGCAWGVNDVDNHTCKSIQQSKNNGFFITEYSIEQSPNSMFDIQEVWQEKTWYYKIVSWFKVTKEFRTHTSEILMTVKETEQSRYRMDNYFTEWSLLQDNITKYVGYNGGSLCLGIEDWSSQLAVVFKRSFGVSPDYVAVAAVSDRIKI